MKKKALVPMLLASTVVLGGCSSINALIVKAIFRVPTAQATMRVAAGVPVEQVFDCAQKRMDELQKPNSFFWRAEITRRDLGAGILETGDFQEDNIMGFRLHLEYQSSMGTVNLRIKGAGIYFADLGVESALATFRQSFDACVAALQ